MNQLIDLEDMERKINRAPGPMQRSFNAPPRHDEIRRGLEELDRLIAENDQLRTRAGQLPDPATSASQRMRDHQAAPRQDRRKPGPAERQAQG